MRSSISTIYQPLNNVILTVHVQRQQDQHTGHQEQHIDARNQTEEQQHQLNHQQQEK